ncbi:mucin-2 [Condylostylus longicornis]|uniref:mucin-2 n=1 Tax=Condylostylus longicornis TaxID=2530218 RepID=UPI00244E32A3|nr:mucin-2 [Condylostylus longicornis]
MRRKNSSPPTIGLENYSILFILFFITGSFAAPIQESTDISQFSEGCYYNYNHYNEGDRILTNEPCLNCTCHNNMLMCYLRVCPFTKPIGQDCIIEKREDQCCPIITCPEVQVDVMMHKGTAGSSAIGFAEKYGCVINNKFFPEGSQVPANPNRPCELCYCIRNSTSCLMQECTLHIDGCQPIYHKGSCCPVRYNCDHELPEIEDMTTTTTTVKPTEGFIMTTIGSDISEQCTHNGETYLDGAMIETENPCDSCYCMKGKIVCAVRECSIPSQYIGRNCTPENVPENECCPQRFSCDDYGIETTTKAFSAEITTSVEDKTEPAISEEDEQLQKHIDDVESEAKPVTQQPGSEEGVTLGGRIDLPEEEKATEVPKASVAPEGTETEAPDTMLTKQPYPEQVDEKDQTTPAPAEVAPTEKPEKEETKPLLPESETRLSLLPETTDGTHIITTESTKEILTTPESVVSEISETSTEVTQAPQIGKVEEKITPISASEKPTTESDKELITTVPSEGVSESMFIPKEEQDKEVTPVVAEHITEGTPVEIAETEKETALVEGATKIPSPLKTDELEQTVAPMHAESVTVTPTKAPKGEGFTLSSGEVITEVPTLPKADQITEAPASDDMTEIVPVSEDKEQITSDIIEEQSTPAYSQDVKTPTPSKPDEEEKIIPTGLGEASTERPSAPSYEGETTISTDEITLTPSSPKIKGEQEDVTETPTKAVTIGPSSPSAEEIGGSTTLIPEEDIRKTPTPLEGEREQPETKTDKTKEGEAVSVAEMITTRAPGGITEEPSKSSEEEPSTEEMDLAIPFAIPGEGDCLLDRKTYKNNTTVPSSNECEYECVCVSSMIKCKTIECAQTAGPGCTILEPAPGACCPTLLCPEGTEIAPEHTTTVAEEAPLKEISPELGERVDSQATESPEEKEVEPTTGADREKDAKKDDSIAQEPVTTPSEKETDVEQQQRDRLSPTEGITTSEEEVTKPTGIEIDAPVSAEDTQTERIPEDKLTEQGPEDATKSSITPDKTTPSLLDIQTLQPDLATKEPTVKDIQESVTTKPDETDKLMTTTLLSMMVPEDQTFKPILESIPSDSHVMAPSKSEEAGKPGQTEKPEEILEITHKPTEEQLENITEPTVDDKLKDIHPTVIPTSIETERPESTEAEVGMVPLKESTEKSELEVTEKPLQEAPGKPTTPTLVPAEDRTEIPEQKVTSAEGLEVESGTKTSEEKASTSTSPAILPEGTETPIGATPITKTEQPIDKEKVDESLEGRIDLSTPTPTEEDMRATEKLPKEEISGLPTESIPESVTEKAGEAEGEPEKEPEISELLPEQKPEMQTELIPEKGTEKPRTEGELEKEKPETSEDADMKTETVPEKETEKPITRDDGKSEEKPEVSEIPETATVSIEDKGTERPTEGELEPQKEPEKSTGVLDAEKATETSPLPDEHSARPEKPTDVPTISEKEVPVSESIERESTEPTIDSTTKKSDQEVQKETSSMPEDATTGPTEPSATKIPSLETEIEKHPDEIMDTEKESPIVTTIQPSQSTEEKTEPSKDKEAEIEKETELPEEGIKSFTESPKEEPVTSIEKLETEKLQPGEIETEGEQTIKPYITEKTEQPKPSESTETPEKEPSKGVTEMVESQTERDKEISKEKTEKPDDGIKSLESTETPSHLESEEGEGSGGTSTQGTPSSVEESQTDTSDHLQVPVEKATESAKDKSDEEVDHTESGVDKKTEAPIARTEKPEFETSESTIGTSDEPTEPSRETPSDSLEISKEDEDKKLETTEIIPEVPSDESKEIESPEIPTRIDSESPKDQKLPTTKLPDGSEVASEYPDSSSTEYPHLTPEDKTKISKEDEETGTGKPDEQPTISETSQTTTESPRGDSREPTIQDEATEITPETSSERPSHTEIEGQTRKPEEGEETTKKSDESAIGYTTPAKEIHPEAATDESAKPTMPSELEMSTEISKHVTEEGEIRKDIDQPTDEKQDITTAHAIPETPEIHTEKPSDIESADHVTEVPTESVEGPFKETKPEDKTETPIQASPGIPVLETTDKPAKEEKEAEKPGVVEEDHISTERLDKPTDKESVTPAVSEPTGKPTDEGTEKPLFEGKIPEFTPTVSPSIDEAGVTGDVSRATDKPEEDRTAKPLLEEEFPDSGVTPKPIDQTSDEFSKATSKPEEDTTGELAEPTEKILKPFDQSSISPSDVLDTTQPGQITEKPTEEKLPEEIEKLHPTSAPESLETSEETTILPSDLTGRLDGETPKPDTKLPEQSAATQQPFEKPSEEKTEIIPTKPSEEKEPTEEFTAKPHEGEVTHRPSETPSEERTEIVPTKSSEEKEPSEEFTAKPQESAATEQPSETPSEEKTESTPTKPVKGTEPSEGFTAKPQKGSATEGPSETPFEEKTEIVPTKPSEEKEPSEEFTAKPQEGAATEGPSETPSEEKTEIVPTKPSEEREPSEEFTAKPQEETATEQPSEEKTDIIPTKPGKEGEPSEEFTEPPLEIKTEAPSEIPSITERTDKEPSDLQPGAPSFTEKEHISEEVTSGPSKEQPEETTATQVPLSFDSKTSTEIPKEKDKEDVGLSIEGVSTEVPPEKPIAGIPEDETRTEIPEEQTEKTTKNETVPHIQEIDTEKPTHLLPVLPGEETRTEVPEEELSQTTQKTPKPDEEESTEVPKKDDAFTKAPIDIPLNETKTDKPIEEPIAEQQTISPLGDKTSKPDDDQKPEKQTEKPTLEEESSTSTTTKVPLTTKPTFMPSIPGYIPPDMPTEYYDEPDDADIFGPGTCRYGGKLFVSAQQIPRDDPCDFCFCFRSDIICLQQSCPPPISGCNEEPIQGFCCPRYECPVSMGYNVNSTTSTTTTTLPPHFLHRRHQKVERNGCQIQGISYKVGDKIPSASGPCMQCTCGGDGQMECNPKPCTPEPMLRQMIAVVASRRRR